MTVATLQQRARKSEQLDNIEKDRIIQRMKDAEERKRWRQKMIKMRSGKMGSKMAATEPPIGLGQILEMFWGWNGFCGDSVEW